VDERLLTAIRNAGGVSDEIGMLITVTGGQTVDQAVLAYRRDHPNLFKSLDKMTNAEFDTADAQIRMGSVTQPSAGPSWRELDASRLTRAELRESEIAIAGRGDYDRSVLASALARQCEATRLDGLMNANDF
jgi:hypothetical protein